MRAIPTELLSGLLLQSAAHLVVGQGFTNESEVPYYGLSPPVYPTPIGNGTTSSRWASAYEQARALSGQMTLEEKVNITRGWDGQCVGASGEIPRLRFPGLCLSDAPDGIRGQEYVSAFPASIHLAATWDRDLMYRYGNAIGDEVRGKGVDVYLGPVAGPLGRMARGGRNWEGLSNDPYLAGAGMGNLVRGVQDTGVIATPKHFVGNEQEFRRMPGEMGEAISSNIDDRTLHELYVFPFYNGLREGAASVMCSYQRVNNSYACQNSKLINGILKTELGLQGFVVSDWQAQWAGVATANAGLDLTMPDAGFWGDQLTDAVNNGSVSADRITDMATRILASWYYLDHDDDYPSPAIYSNLDQHDPVDVQDDHTSIIREVGAAGTVLVKNVNNTLPFERPTFLSVYGYDATLKAVPWENPSRYGGGYEVNFGWDTLNGTLITGGGSGGSTPPYIISPFQAIQERLIRDRGILRWDFSSEDPSPPYVNSDACLVFINAYASESFDRTTLADDFSDRLVNNVATTCSNTIVVMHTAGIRLVEAWIDHPNVTAVLYAGLPGQESGNSLVDVLWGDVSPSGKLPYTVARSEDDYGDLLNSTVSFDAFPQQNFTEGLYIDYRAFDRDDVAPRFEFGFGLSYTTFAYVDLAVALAPGANTSALPDPAVPVIQGGHPALWEPVATVTCTVANTGDATGAEVAQLYVGLPDGEFDVPARQLRGFQKVPALPPGDTATVTFDLLRRDLSVWDVVAQQWRLQPGAYNIYVGASSRDLRLNGTLEIDGS